MTQAVWTCSTSHKKPEAAIVQCREQKKAESQPTGLTSMKSCNGCLQAHILRADKCIQATKQFFGHQHHAEHYTCEEICLIVIALYAVQHLLSCHLCCDICSREICFLCRSMPEETEPGGTSMCTWVGWLEGLVRRFLLRRPTTFPNCSAPYHTAFRPSPRSSLAASCPTDQRLVLATTGRSQQIGHSKRDTCRTALAR